MQCHKSRLDHLNLDSLAGLTKWVLFHIPRRHDSNIVVDIAEYSTPSPFSCLIAAVSILPCVTFDSPWSGTRRNRAPFDLDPDALTILKK